MQNLLQELIAVLSTDDRLVLDGQLMKNKVVELALGLDPTILHLILTNENLKKHFFAEVSGVLIFDKIRFQRFVSNKQFLPDSYTAFKNKIGLVSGDEYVSDTKDVVLVWPYRDCLLEGGQDHDDAARTEVFWNELLAPDQIDRLLSPKALTSFMRYAADGTSVPTPTTRPLTSEDSLIIKGNNLLCLHTLSKVYAGQIKLIYIDPPYNPDSKSNTFSYNNSFNRSTWLTFIQNRLSVAKDLLTPDGVLIVAIDENEQAHLGVLLKELFPNHEVHCVTIVHNPRGIQGTNFSYTHEYAFFVIPEKKRSIGNRKIDAKDIDWRNLRDNGGESRRENAKNCFYGIVIEAGKIVDFTDVVDDAVHPALQTEDDGTRKIVYPIDPQAIERKWRYARQTVESVQHLLRAKKTAAGYEVEIGKDFGTYRTVWQDPRYDSNEYGTKLIKSLVPGCQFNFPKSLWNVYDCLYAVVGDDKNAIVLDFFGGSGTTAHAVLELNKNDGGNRRFILCEQMDYVEAVTVPRVLQVVKNNGIGGFVYCGLAQSNELFVDRIQRSSTSAELEALWSEMQDKAFLSYKVDVGQFDKSKGDFQALQFDDQKRFLIEVLDKNLLYVPLTELDDATYAISEADKAINRQFFKLEKP